MENHGLPVHYRRAVPNDAPQCVHIRGRTRENAVSEQRLSALGITAQTWGQDIRSGELPGFIAMVGDDMAGYCFGSSTSGEIIVLALLPAFENNGIGRHLLQRTVALLHQCGHTRLFLGCSSDPGVRSYGFYRHLGWTSTGAVDANSDEILELVRP